MPHEPWARGPKLRQELPDTQMQRDTLLTATAGLPRAGVGLGGGDGFLKIVPIPLQLQCELRDLSRIPNCSNLGHRDSWALPRAGSATQSLSSGKEHLLVRNCSFHREKEVAFFTLSHGIFKLKIPPFLKKTKKKKITRQGINRN